MAASESSTKNVKAFSFKKKELTTQPIVDVKDESDDDDDFKPTKGSHKPSASTSSRVSVPKGSAKKNVTVKVAVSKKGRANESTSSVAESLSSAKRYVSKKDNSVDDRERLRSYDPPDRDLFSDSDNVTLKEETRVSTVKPAVEEVLVCEMENLDVIYVDEINSAATSSSKNEGKEAWKNLMGKMQKNQENMASKKGKPANKRALVHSPISKLRNQMDMQRSPLKKNARVGDMYGNGNSGMPVKVVKNEKSVVDLGKLTSGLPTKVALGDGPTTIAPIFLPPAERKALQQESSLKFRDTTHLLDSIVDSCSESQNDNLPEDPLQFSGNTVILNDCHPDKDPYEGNKTKVCPFYKKLPGTNFCVDAFNYGLIPGMEVYFLSHFHSDHYIGLSKKFCKTIICSYPTGNLVRMKLYVEMKCIRKLRMNKPYIICETEVTLIDANHCPGSVMFIFRFKNGSVILHTGDFRYTPDMLTNPHLSGSRVDTLYLDTTYCSPEYDFPTQSESVANVVSHVKRHLEYRPQTLIVCGSYLIGKERVYFTLAEAIGSQVFGTFDKRKIINALDNKKFTALLSANENATRVHVVPMFSISAKNLQEYLAKFPQFTNIIGIKPSGWQFSACGTGCSVKTHYNNTVTVLGVPYSEHSSFSELKEFVTNLKPRNVQPTVNVGNPKKRGDMMQHIESWL